MNSYNKKAMKKSKEKILKSCNLDIERLQQDKPLLLSNILKAMDLCGSQEREEVESKIKKLIENCELAVKHSLSPFQANFANTIISELSKLLKQEKL